MKSVTSTLYVALALLVILGVADEVLTDCDANEVADDCGSPCARTCANLNEEIVCTTVCSKGCFCADGYVRQYQDDSGTGPCIQPSAC